MNSRIKTGLGILLKMVGLALALTTFVYLMQRNASSDALSDMFFETLIYGSIIAFPSYWIFPRLLPLFSRRPAFIQWIVFVCTMTAISTVGSLIGSALLLWLKIEGNATFWEIEWVSLRICLFISLVFGVVQAVIERMKDRLEDTRLKLRNEELERERAIKLATEAQLSSLEARLHPHFLFNTLNSISSLIPADPERAERLVERMAALLRFSLDTHRGGLVPLEQEIRIVRDYLEIEQARLGERLRYRIDVGADLSELALPPLSVQTLVENSIKYAIAPNREGGDVQVRASRVDSSLQVDVTDTGPGFVLNTASTGHGLDNLRGRLAALFGDAAALTVGRAGGTTVVTLKVPA